MVLYMFIVDRLRNTVHNIKCACNMIMYTIENMYNIFPIRYYVEHENVKCRAQAGFFIQPTHQMHLESIRGHVVHGFQDVIDVN